MWIQRFGLGLLIISMLFACASASRLNEIRLGMTQQDVIDAIGKPNSTSAQANDMYLKYRLYNDGPFYDDYYVKLTDGKVVAFGQVGDFEEGY
jgi:hypothetical protein